MLQRIVKAVRNDLPKFNDNLIVDLRKKEADNLVAFIADRYRECAEVADPNLVLLNYEILPPITRLNDELQKGMKKNQINIRDNESVLVNYNFQYHDKIFTVSLYVPYLFEDSTIVVNGTHYECLLNVTEKLFSVRASSSGVTIKVIRSPISCWRNVLHPFIDAVTGEQFIGSIVSCKLYFKKITKSKRARPTIIHYLLCKYSLGEVLTRFNVPADAAMYVEHEDFNKDFHYFKIKPNASNKDQIYLKVNRQLMADHKMLHDIVSAILYLMATSHRSVNFQELIHDSKTIYMILLGKIVHNNNIDRIHALSYMIKHIESADTYLDNYTKNLFIANGIHINDIYDLLSFIAENINKIIVSCPNNNMYNKRVEAINNVIIDNLMRTLYRRIYKYDKKPDIAHMTKSIMVSLKVPPLSILKALGSSDSIRFSPSIYSDNWLLSIGNKIVKRLSASQKPMAGAKKEQKTHGSGINAPVNRFHISMMVVESPIGFSSKPGTNCIINPYAEIDETGGFVRNEFAEETANIARNMQTGRVEEND